MKERAVESKGVSTCRSLVRDMKSTEESVLERRTDCLPRGSNANEGHRYLTLKKQEARKRQGGSN